MRDPLLLIVALLLPHETIAGTCDRLRVPPPVFSFKHEEASLYRYLVETIQDEAGISLDATRVSTAFLGCLAQAKDLDGRPDEMQWLDRLTIERKTIKVDEQPIELGLGRGQPLWKEARSVSQRLVRQLGAVPGDKGRDLIWHAWVEGLLVSMGNRYNYYVYASELDRDAGISKGRVFTVGFEVHREGEQLVVEDVLDERLRAAGVVEGASLELLDDRPVARHDYRDLVRFWYSLEPFDYKARLLAGGEIVDVAAAAVPRRFRTLVFVRREAVGYVRIDRFAQETILELRRALRKLSDTEALILDLRGNGGGSLNTELIGMFFKSGEKIVTYRAIGEHAEPEHIRDSVEYYPQRVVVLVDRDTASMSELFAAAIRQHRRGILIGETTSGKGVSQTVLRLADEGELYLVQTEYFYPGTEITWHETGIEPDVRVEMDEEQRQALAELRSAPVVDLEAQASLDPVVRQALRLLEESP